MTGHLFSQHSRLHARLPHWRWRAFATIAGAPDINEVGTGEDFLLAIRKDELANGSKWFVSAFMKQVYPNGVAGGAASSLGIRVVSFRQQNGKLFMHCSTQSTVQTIAAVAQLVGIKPEDVVVDPLAASDPWLDGHIASLFAHDFN